MKATKKRKSDRKVATDSGATICINGESGVAERPDKAVTISPPAVSH